MVKYFKKDDLYLLLIIFICLSVFTGFYGLRSLEGVVRDDVYIASNLHVTKEDKFRREMGFVYDLALLVNKKTELPSKVLIPPQTSKCIPTVDLRYLSYFIYPRYLESVSPIDILVNETGYILIIRGEEKYASQNECLWPSQPINADKVYYVNPDRSFGEYRGNYDPNNFPGIGGLIKLKK